MISYSSYSRSEEFVTGALALITGSDKIGVIFSPLVIKTPMGTLASVITNTSFGLTWLWYATRALTKLT